MANIEVQGQMIDVNIREEMEQYGWDNANWSNRKLIASSPFRNDSQPSFWINFEGEYAGLFGDSGYEDEYYGAGNLPKLLAYLNDFSYEEACQYLLDKYSPIKEDGTIELKASPKIVEYSNKDKVIPKSAYDKPYDKEYLSSRGINQRVTEFHGVFDNGNSIGILWRNLNGDVCAVKYRNKHDKAFWYEKDGTPLSRLVYGLNVAMERGIKSVILCEAEIDALTWQSAGHYAVAIGGAWFNEYQRDLILMSGIEKVILAGDNDIKGMHFNKQAYTLLKDFIDIEMVDYNLFGSDKDANDVGVSRLKEMKFLEVKENEVRL